MKMGGAILTEGLRYNMMWPFRIIGLLCGRSVCKLGLRGEEQKFLGSVRNFSLEDRMVIVI